MPSFASKCASLIVTMLLALSLNVSPASAQDIPDIDASALIKFVVQNKGKVVIVNIFASWCPPCRIEIPGLINTRKKFSQDDVVLLGVSVDKQIKALHAYLGEMQINYPVALAGGDFMQRVGVNAVPQLLIYDRKGELKLNHRGLVEEAELEQILTGLLAR